MSQYQTSDDRYQARQRRQNPIEVGNTSLAYKFQENFSFFMGSLKVDDAATLKVALHTHQLLFKMLPDHAADATLWEQPQLSKTPVLENYKKFYTGVQEMARVAITKMQELVIDSYSGVDFTKPEGGWDSLSEGQLNRVASDLRSMFAKLQPLKLAGIPPHEVLVRLEADLNEADRKLKSDMNCMLETVEAFFPALKLSDVGHQEIADGLLADRGWGWGCLSQLVIVRCWIRRPLLQQPKPSLSSSMTGIS